MSTKEIRDLLDRGLEMVYEWECGDTVPVPDDRQALFDAARKLIDRLPMKRVLHIDYRSPPSGVGQIEYCGRHLNVRFDLECGPGVRSGLGIDEFVVDAIGESGNDYRTLGDALLLLGVTHVRDSELAFDWGDGDEDEFELAEWLRIITSSWDGAEPVVNPDGEIEHVHFVEKSDG